MCNANPNNQSKYKQDKESRRNKHTKIVYSFWPKLTYKWEKATLPSIINESFQEIPKELQEINFQSSLWTNLTFYRSLFPLTRELLKWPKNYPKLFTKRNPWFLSFPLNPLTKISRKQERNLTSFLQKRNPYSRRCFECVCNPGYSTKVL